MMTSLVLNQNPEGEFELSEKAKKLLEERLSKREKKEKIYSVPRHDKDLVEIVEQLGPAASTENSDLRVIQIRGNVYRVRKEEGIEVVETPDSVDWIVVE